jgi:hypothetical protein
MTITQKADGCNKATDPTKNNLPFFQSYGSIFAPCQFGLPEAVIITELLSLRYEIGDYNGDFILTQVGTRKKGKAYDHAGYRGINTSRRALQLN